MKRIGFFGGSFNPVHQGHIRLADYLREHYSLPEVWLSLSPENPLKNASHPGANDSQRLEMLRLACEPYPGLRAWDGELSMPRPSFTVNVLKRLRNEGFDPTLIIGADNWINFNRWFKHEEILSDYQIIVYPRPGYNLPAEAGHSNVSFALSAPQTDVSSTEIRNNIHQELSRLPEPVANYIKLHKLYGY